MKGRAERRAGAFNDRACEALQPRLRGVYRTDSKPVRPPLGAPPGGFGCGCRTSVVPRYCYGTVLCPPLLLRDKALGVVPHRVVSSRGRHHEPPPATTFHRGSQRTPSSLRLQDSPLEDAPSKSEDRCASISGAFRSQRKYFEL